MATIAAVALAAPRGAWASFNAQAEGGYSNSTNRVQDETGHVEQVDSQAWSQRYRLGISQELMPLVSFAANGLLDWAQASSDAQGVHTDLDQKTWAGNARLSFGGPTLNGGVDYDRRWVESTTSTGGIDRTSPTLVREIIGGGLSWRPSDLPSLDLRISRTNTYDSARRGADNTTQDATLTSGFDPVENVDLRLTVRGSENEDRLSGIRTTSLSNAGSIRWNDKFLRDRVNTYASYNVTTLNTAHVVEGPGGSVSTQRFPQSGLSIVEGPLDTPLHVTLNVNAALNDGNTAQSAGMNLGFSASTGLVTFRDLGAQLPNDVTRATRIAIFVDRDVQAVASQLTWTAYSSKDNVDWTPVPLAGPVVYDQLLQRFDIPIQPTQQRYVKVVTKPIVRQLTTDPAFTDIFVTELQLYEDVAASEVRGSSFQLNQSANGTVRAKLLQQKALFYDFSGTITRLNSPSLTTWIVANGLSYSEQLGPRATGAARIERSDSQGGAGHDATTRWSGSVSYDPLATLGGTLAYTGSLSQRPSGETLGNSVSLLARAEFYQGISASGTSSASLTRTETGREVRTTSVSASASIIPNRFVSTSANGAYSWSLSTGAGQPALQSQRGTVEGSLSLAPFPSLSLTGSIARQFGTSFATTLYAFSGAFSPLRGGALVFAYAYQETYDTGSLTRTRSHGPSARWNIRPRWYLSANYSFQDTTTPAQSMMGRALVANLVIAL
jgi:hypothetical protein